MEQFYFKEQHYGFFLKSFMEKNDTRIREKAASSLSVSFRKSMIDWNHKKEESK